MIRRLIAKIFQPSFIPFICVGGMEGGGYEIEKSLRFRSAYLRRTMTSSDNAGLWTYSTWVKLSANGGDQCLFSAGASSSAYWTAINISRSGGANCIQVAYVANSTTRWNKVTTDVFRDPSSWYHLVVAYDYSNATAEDRIRIFVNGERITSFSINTNPGGGNIGYINNSAIHDIGKVWYTGTWYYDGYLSEINFVDGQALGPEEFGRVDPSTGQWIAKPYTGTYGANGFYLDFKDGTDLTTLGQDKSGNGNNWTLNNVSLTSGLTYDWMDDTPSNNFATLNPLIVGSGTASNGNLQLVGTAGTMIGTQTIPTPSTGKWFVEITAISLSIASGQSAEIGLGTRTNGVLIRRSFSGTTTTYGAYVDGVNTGDNSLGFTNGTVFGFAYDSDAGTVGVYINGSLIRTFSIVAGQNLSVAAGMGGGGGSCTIAANFGQRPFEYTPPSGFKSLCTENLKDDTVAVSGSFTGNANANGPFVWCNGTPETLTINGNSVTWGTHADRLANGFKLRTNSASYNASGTNNWTATILSPSRKSSFRNQRAKVN